jgi:hypothetical protein
MRRRKGITTANHRLDYGSLVEGVDRYIIRTIYVSLVTHIVFQEMNVTVSKKLLPSSNLLVPICDKIVRLVVKSLIDILDFTPSPVLWPFTWPIFAFAKRLEV